MRVARLAAPDHRAAEQQADHEQAGTERRRGAEQAVRDSAALYQVLLLVAVQLFTIAMKSVDNRLAPPINTPPMPGVSSIA